MSVFAKNSIYRETWDARRGGSLKIVLTPGKPRSQTSGMGPTASCGYCCPFARYRTTGKGGNGHSRRVLGFPSSGTPPESQVNFRVGTMGEL